MSLEWRFVLVALATWRVTHLLVSEDGPWDAVVRLRAWATDGVLGRAMDCFYCLSLWVAAPLGLAVARDVPTWLVVWLAASGAACVLEQATAERTSGPLMVSTGGLDGMLRTTPSGVAEIAPVATRAGADGAADSRRPDEDPAPR